MFEKKKEKLTEAELAEKKDLAAVKAHLNSMSMHALMVENLLELKKLNSRLEIIENIISSK